MNTRKEIIGDTKVAVFDQPIDAVAISRTIADYRTAQDVDDAFILMNIDQLMARHRLWKTSLPQIEPFYAVKCNNDRVLLRTLAALGVGFDCASKEEIDIVMDMGIESNRIIYANPCKTRSFIKHAEKRGVQMMTFDNLEELSKVASLHESAEMILRIAVSDPTATCPLNLKFGAEPMTAAPRLLQQASAMGVNVCGVSFHVGSGCNDPSAYRTAIMHARNLFDIGTAMGHKMELVDMGGGFPGAEHHISFEEIARLISAAVEEFFPEPSVRLIAEPGRFFAASPFTLVANVITATQVPASKITKDEKDGDRDGFMYYLNDGVYGSFNCILFDHVHPIGEPLFEEKGEEFSTTIWGPTCDSLDMIEENRSLRRLDVGDWMRYDNMGAYTSAASTTFNGFARPQQIYVVSNHTWNEIAEFL